MCTLLTLWEKNRISEKKKYTDDEEAVLNVYLFEDKDLGP